MARRCLKLTIGIVLLFAGFVLLYFSVAFVCSRITIGGEGSGKQEVAIYIKTNGVHTDIVVPVHTEDMDWSHEVKYANTTGKDRGAAYLSIGWGDKGFYLQTPEWKDLKFSVAFNAAFGLSTTAIHATYYNVITEDEQCRKIVISSEQYARLTKYLINSFRKDAAGHFINVVTTANYGTNDAFYEAIGSYHLFRTCNTWSNTALKECGQKSCLWTIFDTGIFLKYK